MALFQQKAPAAKAAVSGAHLEQCRLLVTVTDRRKAEFYADYLQSFRINIQMILRGCGTASSEMMGMLGLDRSDRAVILSLVREDCAGKALSGLEEKFHTVRNGKGIAFTIPLSSVIGAAIYRFMTDHRSDMGL